MEFWMLIDVPEPLPRLAFIKSPLTLCGAVLQLMAHLIPSHTQPFFKPLRRSGAADGTPISLSLLSSLAAGVPADGAHEFPLASQPFNPAAQMCG
ncbi:hypothetical protein AVEN_113773-1 [Araneus ventricosus]|uniref:Uncharacterized protein n=1 Tax=Araneus ventricosus TaxID=182803 RepID=A0A4Y2N659_ARAVE|nr:hypothetical protein AVEN_113773-1 [Araneus ventricosus]